jgi:C1A family cysteine protease
MADFEAAKEFSTWTSKNSKSYLTVAEKSFRFVVFKDNLQTLESIRNQNLGFEVGLGKFGDMTNEEFLAQHTGLISLERREKEPSVLGSPIKNSKPTSWRKYYKNVLAKNKNTALGQSTDVDWHMNNRMGKVRNQGRCGSCYSFAAAVVAQSHYSLRKGVNVIEFSEQQIVDCSKPYGNMGCNGGLNEASLQFIADSGAMPRSKYPYSATHSDYCKHVPASAIKAHNSYTLVPSGKGDLMVEALKQGPLAAEIDATVLKYYKSGIIQNAQGVCSPTATNHAVTIFGIGSFSGGKYWKVRNSWGEDWGESGDFRIIAEMSGTGLCQISKKTSVPVY